VVSQENTQQRLLVVGCGSIGKRHIQNLLALNAGPIAAFDPRPDRQREVREELRVEVFDRLASGLDWQPSVVIVSTPTSHHLPAAIHAAKRNCNLFIEKPLSHSFRDITALVDIVEENRLVCFVACNTRFEPGIVKIRELLQHGAVGRVLSARAEAGQYLPDWHPWEDYRETYSARRSMGGGVILDAVHEVDYLRWLIGEVAELSCIADRIGSLAINTEDTALVNLRFASGALGHIHLDYLQRSYNRNCQIVGEKGTIRWDFSSGNVNWYSADDRDWHIIPRPSEWRTNDMYLDEMRHFLDCLEGKSHPMSDVHDGRRILEIAVAAKQSSRSKQMVTLKHPVHNIVAIIQARMGSSRLPGKTLADIAGKPLLTRVIERAFFVERLNQIIVATTTDSADDRVEQVARQNGAFVFRGDADDVLDRYYQAALLARADIIIRITADDPFKDPNLISQAIYLLLEDHTIDYVKVEPCPEGLEVEVLKFSALEKAWKEARLPSEREHVTPYIWKNPDKFKLHIIPGPKDSERLRLTLDYEQDLEFARQVYSRLERAGEDFSLQDVVELLKAQPELATINAGIQPYAGYAISVAREHEPKD